MDRRISPATLKTVLAGKYILDVRRSGDRDIGLYGVRGGTVSNSVVDALRARGLKARFIEGWKAAGGKVVPK